MWLPQFSLRGLLLAVVPFAVSAAMWPVLRERLDFEGRVFGLVLVGGLTTSSVAWLAGVAWMRVARREPDDHQAKREEVFRFAAGSIVAVYALGAIYVILVGLDLLWKPMIDGLPEDAAFVSLGCLTIFALVMLNLTIFWRAVATVGTFEFRCPHDRDLSLLVMRLAYLVTTIAVLNLQFGMLD